MSSVGKSLYLYKIIKYKIFTKVSAERKSSINCVRKGYTLNELIITIAIITILGAFFVKGIQNYKIYINNVDVDYCNNSILGLINDAKSYCRSKEVNGYIFFDTKIKTIYFIVNSELVNKYLLPSKFILNNITLGQGSYSMVINANGFTSDACTISYLDREGNKHKISVCVGTSYVEIKD